MLDFSLSLSFDNAKFSIYLKEKSISKEDFHIYHVQTELECNGYL